MDFEEKIISLETKIAYLEDFVSDLNKVVIEQEKMIRTLSLVAEAIKKEIEEKKEKLPEGEKPPHY